MSWRRLRIGPKPNQVCSSWRKSTVRRLRTCRAGTNAVVSHMKFHWIWMAAVLGGLQGGATLHAQVTYEPYAFSLFAGQAGSLGSNDGTGNAARFNVPQGAAVDKNGNVYIADTGNDAIRKISPAAVV